MHLSKEGIQQAKDASETYERLSDTVKQAISKIQLASLFHHDNQLDAADQTACYAIDLSSGEDEQLRVFGYYRVFGSVHHSEVQA